MGYTYTKEDAAIFEDEYTQLSEEGVNKLMEDVKKTDNEIKIEEIAHSEKFRQLHGISLRTYDLMSDEAKDSFWDDLDVSSRESFLRFIRKFSTGFVTLNGPDYLMLKFQTKRDFRKFLQKILYTESSAEIDDEYIVAKQARWVLDHVFDGIEEMLVTEFGEVYVPIKGLPTQGFLK